MEPENRLSFRITIQWAAAIAWALAFPACGDGASFWLFIGAAVLVLVPFLMDKVELARASQAGLGKAFRDKQDKSVRRRFFMLESMQVILIMALGLGLVLGMRRLETGLDILRPISEFVCGRGTEYLITPSYLIIAIPLMVAVFGLMCVVATCLSTLMAGRHLDAWREYNRLKGTYLTKGGQPRQASPPFLWKFFIASLVSVVLFLGIYARVTDRGMTVKHWWNLSGEFYAWDSIRTIEKLEWEGRGENLGKIYYEYRITFSDGSTWRSEDSSFASTRKVVDPAIRYIASRSGT